MKVVMTSLVEGARTAQGVCVLIDVFRSSNTMLVLLSRGSEIVQAATVEQALKLKQEHPDWKLFGEVGGFPPEGFDHGNSPVECKSVPLTPTVILCTSAGSAGIYAMKEAENVIIASFANAQAVVNRLWKMQPKLVTLVAVGKEGVEEAAEDELCADHLHNTMLGCPIDIQDTREEILNSPTAQRLRDRGQTDDIEFCLEYDIFDFAPMVHWENGLAIVRKD
jgi:2-phosphosulfolactate phosphatase